MPDTDHDGIPDGVDTQPLNANVVSATPTSLAFAKLDGAADPLSQNLTIASPSDPFFYWTLSANQPWINVSSSGAFGGGAVAVSVKTTGFRVSGSPYTGAITITAPGLPNSPLTVPVKVTVAQAAPILSVNPSSLSFTGFVGGPDLPAQSVQHREHRRTARCSGRQVRRHRGYESSRHPEPAREASRSASIQRDLVRRIPPYTGTVRISAAGAANSPSDIAVSLSVLPARVEGESFPISVTSLAQSDPSVDYESGKQRYAVGWSENGGIRARLFDVDGYPAGRRPLTFLRGFQGYLRIPP